jgi:hypothetical protein
VLQGFADASYAEDQDNRRSCTGYLFTAFGGVIAWNSCAQERTSLSSCEAEYRALTRSATEAIWLRRLMSSFGHHQSAPTLIHEDNQGAICLAYGTQLRSRLKHVEVRAHFIRDCVRHRQVQLRHISTQDQWADILTKPLARVLHNRFRTLLGVLPANA